MVTVSSVVIMLHTDGDGKNYCLQSPCDLNEAQIECLMQKVRRHRWRERDDYLSPDEHLSCHIDNLKVRVSFIGYDPPYAQDSTESLPLSIQTPSKRLRLLCSIMRFVPKSNRDHIIGDLEEEYHVFVMCNSRPTAYCWYLWQVACVISAYSWKIVKASVSMKKILKVIGIN